MSYKWLSSEIVFDVLLAFLLLVFSNPARTEAIVPKVMEFIIIGQETPLPSMVQTASSLMLAGLLFILLFSSITPIVLGLLLESKDLVESF